MAAPPPPSPAPKVPPQHAHQWEEQYEFLCADLPSERSRQPRAFDTKLEFWSALVEANAPPVFSVRELADRLKKPDTEGRTLVPSRVLARVVAEMRRAGEAVPIEEAPRAAFKAAAKAEREAARAGGGAPSQSPGVAPRLVEAARGGGASAAGWSPVRPLMRMFGMGAAEVGSAPAEYAPEHERFALPGALAARSKELHRAMTSNGRLPPHGVVLREEVKRELGEACAEEVADAVLATLEGMGLARRVEGAKSPAYALARPGAGPAEVREAAEQGAVVADMAALLRSTGEQAERLQGRADERRAQARACVAAGRRAEARLHLASRQRLLKALEQRLAVRNNAEELMLALETAAENKNMVKVLGNASAYLKSANAEAGVDRVDDLMLDLGEAMEETAAISDAVAQPLEAGGAVVDDDELAAELAALEHEADAETDAAELPAAPTRPLGGRTESEDLTERLASSDLLGSGRAEERDALAA